MHALSLGLLPCDGVITVIVTCRCVHRSEQSVQQWLSLWSDDSRNERQRRLWCQASRADIDAGLRFHDTRRPATRQEYQSDARKPRPVAQIPHARHRDDHHQVWKVRHMSTHCIVLEILVFTKGWRKKQKQPVNQKAVSSYMKQHTDCQTNYVTSFEQLLFTAER